MTRLHPENVEIALVAFEGPDEYARAGGLAVRVRDLSEAFAASGFRTHLFFIGDPALPPVEQRGNLTLHRWSQWISAYHPTGVYEGEWGKLQDLRSSLPPFLAGTFVPQAAKEGRLTAVMGEDWQTVETMIDIHARTKTAGLERSVIPVWTANNVFGFHGIDWAALQQASALMTVSRYMKHEMWRYGVDPLVVPNGLAPSAFVDVDRGQARKLRNAFNADIALFKIGRFSPDKRWLMAVEALALLKQAGTRARLLMRGDRSPHGHEVMARAEAMGLIVANLTDRFTDALDLGEALAARPDADIYHLTSFLPDELVPLIYAAVDGVLANSGHEPFGLVGLEVMAAGGLAFVGSTGEEYAEADRNAIVLDTDDPRELVVQIQRLAGNAEHIKDMKKHGKKTAKQYLWERVLPQLLTKLEYVAMVRGVEVPE